MPRRFLSDIQREEILSLPVSMTKSELMKHFVFNPEEEAVIFQCRGNANRLGMALQIALLHYPGRAMYSGEIIPEYVLKFVCRQLNLKKVPIYSRDNTRNEHLQEIQAKLGYCVYGGASEDSLRKHLFPIALKVDDGMTLITEGLEELRRQKVIIPGITTIEELVWDIREQARKHIQGIMVQNLTSEQKLRLDQLLELKDASLTYLSWLRQPNGNPSPDNVLKVIAKIEHIRSIELDLNMQQYIHQNRFVQLAREGSTYSAQSLKNFKRKKRYTLLLTFLLRHIEDLTDQVFDMHDRQMVAMLNRCKNEADKTFQSKSKSIKKALKDYGDIGEAIIQAKEEGTDAIGGIEAILPWEAFVKSVQEAKQLSDTKKFDHLMLARQKYQRLRPYIREMLKHFDYQVSPSCRSIGDALALIKELNETGQRNLPEEFPDEFVTERWHKLMYSNGSPPDRRYYEILCMLLLKDRLRAGDISVLGSRQYKDFKDLLLLYEQWLNMLETQSIPLDVPIQFEHYIESRKALLNEQFLKVSRMINRGEIPEVRLKDGQINIGRLDKDVPDEAKAFSRQLYSMLPRIKITDLLVEVDSWTNFTDYFTHLKRDKPIKNKTALLATLLAESTNMGYAQMADSTANISAKQLHDVSDWYIRDDTLKRAQAELVNYQHSLDFSQQFGSGTTSSSDGQSFQLERHKSSWLNLNAKYGKEPVITIYTHLSDQYMPFYTQVIHNVRDASHVLDGLLYHETDLEIEEHYTDTAGFTDHIFALCHLLGFKFAPRIRDLAEKNLYFIDKDLNYGLLEPLLGEKLKLSALRKNWEDILHLASSVKLGTVPASLILKKLASYPRQNNLALALRELGRLERTLFILSWLQDAKLRRRVLIGLNKG